ncbi:AraC family transcriptional regulator [Mucilaginibacter aquatilis]|nr:AraC family transcriptional regulator [Mucilaginibacter aquatilis]
MDNLTMVTNKVSEGFIGQRSVLVPTNNQSKLALNPLSSMLYVTAAGYYPLALNHDRERTYGSEDYILIYCVDGSGWIEIDGVRNIAEANTFYIIPPGQRHHYGSSGKNPWSIYWLHFTGSNAAVIYNSYESFALKNNYVVYNQNRIDEFSYLMDLLESDLNPYFLEVAYVKLIGLLGTFIFAGDAGYTPEPDSIDASVAFMKLHIKSNFLISDFARQANYSVSRYSELFRQRTGYAPMQYFNHLKIHMACQYLSFTSMSVKQICNELGYDDQYYFSRLFKKITTHPPLKYRKANKI